MASELTEYENQRIELIARNRARLVQLGIPSAVEGLSILAPKKTHVRYGMHGLVWRILMGFQICMILFSLCA